MSEQDEIADKHKGDLRERIKASLLVEAAAEFGLMAQAVAKSENPPAEEKQ